MKNEVAASKEFTSTLNAEDEGHFIVLAKALDCIDNTEPGSWVSGISTGYENLDRMTSGFQPGELIVVAARPGMGKTSFTTNIAENIAINGKLVAIYSMAMGTTQLAMRMLGSVGRINQHDLRTNCLGEEAKGRLTLARGQLSDASIFIDETPELSALEIRKRASSLLRRKGSLDLIIVDYLQLMSADLELNKNNRASEISEMSRSLKAMARELQVPVVLLSQISRCLEQRPNKRPVMSDLRESGAIEQDADLVLFIYRDEVYDLESPDKGVAEIIVGKQRNGPIGTVKMAFQSEFMRFEELANDRRYSVSN